MNHSGMIDDDKGAVQTIESSDEQVDTVDAPPVKKTWRDRTAFLKSPKFYKVLVLGQCK